MTTHVLLATSLRLMCRAVWAHFHVSIVYFLLFHVINLINITCSVFSPLIAHANPRVLHHQRELSVSCPREHPVPSTGSSLVGSDLFLSLFPAVFSPYVMIITRLLLVFSIGSFLCVFGWFSASMFHFTCTCGLDKTCISSVISGLASKACNSFITYKKQKKTNIKLST